MSFKVVIDSCGEPVSYTHLDVYKRQAQYTENENAIVRNLLRDYLEASAILGIKDELTEKAELVRCQMVPTAIGSEGQILEWNEEFGEVDQHHRHLSHLYELHPGRGITEAVSYTHLRCSSEGN